MQQRVYAAQQAFGLPAGPARVVPAATAAERGIHTNSTLIHLGASPAAPVRGAHLTPSAQHGQVAADNELGAAARQGIQTGVGIAAKLAGAAQYLPFVGIAIGIGTRNPAATIPSVMALGGTLAGQALASEALAAAAATAAASGTTVAAGASTAAMAAAAAPAALIGGGFALVAAAIMTIGAMRDAEIEAKYRKGAKEAVAAFRADPDVAMVRQNLTRYKAGDGGALPAIQRALIVAFRTQDAMGKPQDGSTIALAPFITGAFAALYGTPGYEATLAALADSIIPATQRTIQSPRDFLSVSLGYEPGPPPPSEMARITSTLTAAPQLPGVSQFPGVPGPARQAAASQELQFIKTPPVALRYLASVSAGFPGVPSWTEEHRLPVDAGGMVTFTREKSVAFPGVPSWGETVTVPWRQAADELGASFEFGPGGPFAVAPPMAMAPLPAAALVIGQPAVPVGWVAPPWYANVPAGYTVMPNASGRAGWEIVRTAQGAQFYWNITSGALERVGPSGYTVIPLASGRAGWEIVRDGTGRRFYWNIASGALEAI